jgi:hypothetical protein
MQAPRKPTGKEVKELTEYVLDVLTGEPIYELGIEPEDRLAQFARDV